MLTMCNVICLHIEHELDLVSDMMVTHNELYSAPLTIQAIFFR